MRHIPNLITLTNFWVSLNIQIAGHVEFQKFGLALKALTLIKINSLK